MSDEQAVLFANEAFYRAFADGDLDAMAELWARDAAVACIHPGWNALEGREPVIDSWAAIFQGPNRPDIRCREAIAHVYGDVAFVVCYEILAQGLLIATNIFVREEATWRMVHHQAGPTAALPPPEERELMH